LTLLANGNADKPDRGNSVVRKSRAADDCLALMAPRPLPDPESGVRGGVAGTDWLGEMNFRALKRELPEAKDENGRDSTEELGVEPGVIGREELLETRAE